MNRDKWSGKMEQESSIQTENIETGGSTKVEPTNPVKVPQNVSNVGVNPAIRQNLVCLISKFTDLGLYLCFFL